MATSGQSAGAGSPVPALAGAVVKAAQKLAERLIATYDLPKHAQPSLHALLLTLPVRIIELTRHQGPVRVTVWDSSSGDFLLQTSTAESDFFELVRQPGFLEEVWRLAESGDEFAMPELPLHLRDRHYQYVVFSPPSLAPKHALLILFDLTLLCSPCRHIVFRTGCQVGTNWLGFWEYDLEKDLLIAGGRLRDLVPSAIEVSVNDPVSKWLTYVHPDERLLLLESAQRTLQAQADDFHFLCRVRCYAGNYFWLRIWGYIVRDDLGRPVRLLGWATDSTLEEDFERTIQQLRSVVASATALLFQLDPTGKFIEVNRAVIETLGYSREELSSKSLAELLDDEASLAQFQQFIEHSGQAPESFRQEVSVRTKSGKRVRLHLQLIPLRIQARCKGFQAIARDITQVQLKEILGESRRRYDALSSLVAGIAHDLNNILTAIDGFAELACEQASSPEAVIEAGSMIRHSVKRAANLTAQLSQFARGGQLLLEKVDLAASLEEICAFLRKLLPESIYLQTRWLGKVYVLADREQLFRVLLNLTLNACDAMPEGGELTIELSKEQVCLEVANRLEVSPGEYAKIMVADTGIGIPASLQDRIFEPYFTTKKRSSGLGLATVYGLVRGLGGAIEVETNQPRGSRFTIYLPVAS